MAGESTALVLQGGGALGAYQGGALEALSEGKQPIDWISGISIGAINAALIAGNPPEDRVAALRRFWEMVSSAAVPVGLFDGVLPRVWLNELSAMGTTITGVPGFFRLRQPSAALMPIGSKAARSYYDTAPLRDTLLELADFDRINDGSVRLSVGAVNVATGNMKWFDSEEVTIRPEHIMASGALPPGFPAVEIDGKQYWDGGLVSNTPLQYVLDERCPTDDLCIFQVDLFSARGPIPKTVWTVEAREKDIRFSSRTRFNTDMMQRLREKRRAARRLYERLPKEFQNDPDILALMDGEADPNVTIAHLIYRHPEQERASKDYEFSRQSMLDHWSAGYTDARHTLTHPDWIGRHSAPGGVTVFDLTRD